MRLTFTAVEPARLRVIFESKLGVIGAGKIGMQSSRDRRRRPGEFSQLKKLNADAQRMASDLWPGNLGDWKRNMKILNSHVGKRFNAMILFMHTNYITVESKPRNILISRDVCARTVCWPSK